MADRTRWFERDFELGMPLELFPGTLERLRGMPARLEERVRPLGRDLMVWVPEEGTWSIQENVGHLLDLELLWAQRVGELVAGAAVLSPADLENRATDEAGHNDKPQTHLLMEFRLERQDLVARLEELSDHQLIMSSLHPRLQKPMTAIDLAFFVAEHDDHHLAQVTKLLRLSGNPDPD